MDFIGVVASLLSAVGWAICIVCFTIAVLKIGGSAGIHIMNLQRCILASVGLAIIYLVSEGNFHLPTLSTGHAVRIALAGVVTLVIADTFLYLAAIRLGPGYSTLLFNTYPIMTALLALPWYGEKLNASASVGLLITFAGVGWVSIERSRLNRKEDVQRDEQRQVVRGIVFGLCAAIGQAIGFLILIPVMEGEQALSPLFVNLFRFVAASIGFAVIVVQQRLVLQFFKTYAMRSTMLWILAGALIGNILASWFSLIPFSEAHRIPSGIATALMSTMPIAILPFVVFGPQIVRERVNWKICSGVAVAVAGIIVILNTSAVFH